MIKITVFILQNALDEMERKKERIMLLSLQRRQHQEELKQHKEQEAQHRRELEKLKQEERERKKEEERLRRASILEQHKLKKAIEEAEREVNEFILIIYIFVLLCVIYGHNFELGCVT
jgi:cytochrome c-type biogenesis protein CcmH/NrfG